MPTTKTAPAKRSSMDQIGVRIPPPLLDMIDALVAERNAAAGWVEVNRSDVVRELVIAGLGAIGRPFGAARAPEPARRVEHDEGTAPPKKRPR